jgi:hypothetical protein
VSVFSVFYRSIPLGRPKSLIIKQYEAPNGVPWSIILDGMYPGVTTHRGTLNRLLTEACRNDICNHLGVSTTAFKNKLKREGIAVKTLNELILGLDTASMTKRQMAEALGCTESRAGQLVKKLNLPSRPGRALLKEKYDAGKKRSVKTGSDASMNAEKGA